MFFSIIMILVSLFSTKAAIDSFRNPKFLYQEGDKYTGESGYSIIRVLGIEELSIEDELLEDGEKFYMVETENNFVILKSTRKNLKKVVGDKFGENAKLKKFENEEVYARIDSIPETTRKKRKTVTNVSQELQQKFKNASSDSNLIFLSIDSINSSNLSREEKINKIKERPFYYNIYIEPSGVGYNIIATALAAILILITVFMIIQSAENIRSARESYERLFIEYPETERDLDILLRDALFLDEKLKVLVYKESIINYKSVFNFELLNEVSKISFKKTTHKNNVYYHMNIVLADNNVPKNIALGKHKKETENYIREFGKFLRSNYNVKVNYDL